MAANPAAVEHRHGDCPPRFPLGNRFAEFSGLDRLLRRPAGRRTYRASQCDPERACSSKIVQRQGKSIEEQSVRVRCQGGKAVTIGMQESTPLKAFCRLL